MLTTHQSWIRWRWLLLAAAAMSIAGCRSVEQLAPPVSESFVSRAAADADGAAKFERGRKIYLRQCISCHTVQPVDGWSLDEWEKILPEMSEESHLSAAQSDDLRAYIRAAHAYLIANPAR